ncbi:RGS domain-containing serine/threonine-protein kinase A [Cercospora beticola]|uniref:EKC/KEOPS complex subunit BUD32 n=1 Tax=Cercospora beticola TaxID=122368 RepID=A0A2G5H8Z2_CERBT|nr:RGS domain-containing serine/threonine-protein kinase A [Cercospora beticola]PIA88692.1 RGS domain-containing serine/threonine-protein kinase A [Cercospora beticola]WPB02899.1 hypothetical protein RHO25_007535 [Cercospora beticola]CAK1358404.1 unnamed protein product [Cercospora beticola]
MSESSLTANPGTQGLPAEHKNFPNIPTISAEGEIIDGGVTGLVCLQDDGTVIKYSWPEQEECEEEMAQEAHAYRRLFELFGHHPRFVKFLSHDQHAHTITMEYMPNGTLRSYLRDHHESISKKQRFRWIAALAEGLELLHSANIVHCDFSTKNLLLDHDLELKVADFGCSSLDGGRTNGGGSARFYPPREWRTGRIEAADDLFALGSCIFEILTGRPPYDDLETRRVGRLYGLRQFPDLVGMDFADVIRDCWLFRGQSAREVHHRLLEAL